MIHLLAGRLPAKQLPGIPIKEKIDAAHVNAEMICLGKKGTIEGDLE
jgi:hypothetical protein